MDQKKKVVIMVEHQPEHGGALLVTRIEDPVRLWQAADENGNGALRVEFDPTRANLAVSPKDAREGVLLRPGLPQFRPHTVDQIMAHIDEGEALPGAGALRAIHQAITDGFGSMLYYAGVMSDGKPGDKFIVLHVHATNVHGIVITRDHYVVLQRESRLGRVDKTPILQGICGGCKSVADVSKVFRSEALAENGCRPGPDAVVYDVACGPAGRAKVGNFWTEDGVFGWPEHYIIATGYDAKPDHSRLSENISGVELVPLPEFVERARRLEYEDLTLPVLASTLILNEEGHFAGIAAPHERIWAANGT